LASSITTWKTETSVDFDLAYLTRETRDTLAREARVIRQTSSIVATWLTQTQIQLVLTSEPEKVCWTKASEAVRQTQTSRSVETRVRLAIVYWRFTIGTCEPVATRAIDGAIERSATQSAILTHGRIAQVDERVASSTCVSIGTQTFELVWQVDARATVETDRCRRVGAWLAKVNRLFASFASESACTVAIEAVEEIGATGAILAWIRSALIDQLRAVLACVAK